jgi:hypothetical protein
MKHRNETITFVIMPVSCFFGLRKVRLLGVRGGGVWLDEADTECLYDAGFFPQGRDKTERI